MSCAKAAKTSATVAHVVSAYATESSTSRVLSGSPGCWYEAKPGMYSAPAYKPFSFIPSVSSCGTPTASIPTTP